MTVQMLMKNTVKAATAQHFKGMFHKIVYELTTYCHNVFSFRYTSREVGSLAVGKRFQQVKKDM